MDAITRLVITVIASPYCQTCGKVLGYNIVVIEGQPPPELLCKECRRPRRILADGTGVPLGEGTVMVARKLKRRIEALGYTEPN